MTPLFKTLLGISILVSTVFAGPSGSLFCGDNQTCCLDMSIKLANGEIAAGQCLPPGTKCPAGTTQQPFFCGNFPITSPHDCGPNGCYIQYATHNFSEVDGRLGTIYPGTSLLCLSYGQKTSAIIDGESFPAQDCAKNYPNKHVKPLPICSQKEFCCVEYAGYFESGILRAGQGTACGTDDQSCPLGFERTGDADCSKNWPNFKHAPLPLRPSDCQEGQYTCIEYANQAKNVTLPGMATTCQQPWEGCPAHYQGFPSKSFQYNWPNKNLQPLPRDCGPEELCCMDPAYYSQTYPNAFIGGMGAECRPKADKDCKRPGYVAINSNKCSKAVPFFYRYVGEVSS